MDNSAGFLFQICAKESSIYSIGIIRETDLNVFKKKCYSKSYLWITIWPIFSVLINLETKLRMEVGVCNSTSL